MTSSATANYDRINSDTVNNGKRIGTEGGIASVALGTVIAFLLAEFLASPPASAEQAGPKSAIPKGRPDFNPQTPHWSREADTSNEPVKINFPEQAPLSLDGLRVDVGLTKDKSPLTSRSQDIPQSKTPTISNSTQTSNQSPLSTQSSLGNTSSDSGITFPYPYIKNAGGENAGGENAGGEATQTALDDNSINDPNPLLTYRLVAIVKTTPDASSTSIEGESISTNSGTQEAIHAINLITRGNSDQILAFSQRLLNTSSRSIESSSSVIQDLEHSGINSSIIDPSGVGAIVNVSLEELLVIAQESGTTLLTHINQDIAGIRESDIDLTRTNDLMQIKTTSDIQFLGQSDTDGWNQEINVKNVGMKGLETTKSVSTKEEDLTSELPEEETGDSQIVDTSSSLDPFTVTKAPVSNVNLGDGNNTLFVSSTIGENSLWIANSKVEDCEEDCGDGLTKDTKSILNLEAVAVDDYNINGGTGQDNITLIARVKPEFIESWEEEMNNLSLEIEQINTQSVALRGSYLSTGDGSDRVITEGNITGSIIDLGTGDDQIYVDGAIQGSRVNLGEGDDIALLASPPELTSILLGGSGLDTLSFSGSTQSIRIDLQSQTVNYAKIDSFEIGMGGLSNDVLVAGDDTVYLDGAEGKDTYILNSQSSGAAIDTPLNLALTPTEILNGTDQLVRWDKASDTHYKQEGIAIGLNIALDNTLPTGVELLPIGTLESLINFMGLSDANSSQISPWAIMHGGDNVSGNSLIQWDTNSPNGFNVVAGLAYDSSQDLSATSSAG